MQEPDDQLEIKDTTIDGEKVRLVKIKTPYAVPATRGIITPIILGILAAAIAVPFLAPTVPLVPLAIGNGISALCFFWLYRVSSTLAAKLHNEVTLVRAVYTAEMDLMRKYVTEIAEKNEGNLSEENLSNPSTEGKLEGKTEQE